MPRILWLYILLVVAALGYTGYWFHLAGRSGETVDALARAGRADGLAISYTVAGTGGYPYRLETELAAPSVGRPDAAAPWSVAADGVVVVAQPWDFRHYIAIAEGATRLSYAPGRDAPDIALAADRARASLILDRRYAPLRLSMEFDSLATADGAAVPMRADKVLIHARRAEPDGGAGGAGAAPMPGNGALDTALRIEHLRLPPEIGGVLGPDIAAAAADATLSGPLPARLAPAEMAAWRDAGGTATVRALAVDWGPLRLDGAGTLTLDAELRPAGTLKTRVAGFDALIDALTAAGRLNDNAAGAVRLALKLVEERPADGGAPVVRLPLVLKDGWASLGPLRLFPVAPLFSS